MSKNPYNQTEFLVSAAKMSQLPPDEGAEIAFIGRSNSGKSTAINLIVGIKNLARVSKTPGRTQLLNFFSIDTKKRFVDLPGYGYAKVPNDIRSQWQKTLLTYFSDRTSLRALVLIMDIRHPLKTTDQQMLDWTEQLQLPTHILLTKADKISRGEALQTLQKVKKELETHTAPLTIQLFSSLSKIGVAEARAALLEYFKA